MLEPMALKNLFLGTMAGAAVVMTGAFYALFFALGRLRRSATLAIVSNLAYASLVAAVYVLVDALTLRGFWIVVAAVMLVGYFFLPRAIWHLCVGTHAGEAGERLRATQ